MDAVRYIDADKLKKNLTIPSASIIEIGKAITAQIDDQPTADVRENVSGEWLHEPYINNTWVQRCSNCFHVAMISSKEECPYNYCPKCGAQMKGDTT